MKFWSKRSPEEKLVEKFAEKLVENGQTLAKVRSQKCRIPSEKYIHLQNLAQILVFNCYAKASIKYEEIEDKENNPFFLFFLEYLCFFIHLIDRAALTIIGDPERHSFMDELGEFVVILSIQTLLPKVDDLQAKQFFVDSMGYLNITTDEYAQYKKIIPIGDEGPKDTLFWEFSKKIAKLTGSESNIGAVVGEEHTLAVILKNLEVNSFLEKMK